MDLKCDYSIMIMYRCFLHIFFIVIMLYNLQCVHNHIDICCNIQYAQMCVYNMFLKIRLFMIANYTDLERPEQMFIKYKKPMKTQQGNTLYVDDLTGFLLMQHNSTAGISV